MHNAVSLIPLAALALLASFAPPPQKQTWDVHSMERPLPLRVEPAGPVTDKAPKGATILFDGNSLDAWQHDDGSAAKWTVNDGAFVVKPGTGKVITKETFRDVHLHIEWMVPASEANDEGQGRGNSGVFLMGLYEVQVLESVGGKTYADGMAGSLYGQFPPLVNAGSGIDKWNSYDIFFRAPTFEGDKVKKPARITVLHNGHTLHAGRELLGITRHKVGTKYHLHANKLPIALQDHSDPVHYRNVWVRPLPPETEPHEKRTLRLRAHVDFLCDLEPTRTHQNLASSYLAAEYIAEQFRGHGWQVDYQDFTVDGRVHRNVIAHVGEADGDLIVLGAHYDTCEETPGADDNASGVAALIEISRELQAAPPTTPVQLVAYALEEPPYFGTDEMGSVRHARSLKEDGKSVRAMVALEMLGYYSDRPDSQSYPVEGMSQTYPTTANFIAVVTRPEDADLMRVFSGPMKAAMALDVQTLAAPAMVTGIDFSDHRSYWAAGFPALMITDTAFFRNPHYHEPGDRPETLDYTRMAQIVDGVLAGLKSLAKPR